MKINDVDLTLFAWAGIPATRYGPLTGKFGGRSQLGLLSVDRIEKKKIALLREKRKP